MAKIIKLTESDLERIVKRVIKEQTNNLKKEDVVKCASLGIKSPGYCDKKTRKPLKKVPCSFIGVKFFGDCDGITGKPIRG